MVFWYTCRTQRDGYIPESDNDWFSFVLTSGNRYMMWWYVRHLKKVVKAGKKDVVNAFLYGNNIQNVQRLLLTYNKYGQQKYYTAYAIQFQECITKKSNNYCHPL